MSYSRGIWFAPTLLWFSNSSHALLILCWVGMVASLLLTLNVWPRAMLAICFVCFLSFVSAAQDFSGYQSDGMLLEAGFVALFFAPPDSAPLGAGVATIARQFVPAAMGMVSHLLRIGGRQDRRGDPEWRHFTAMDEYYQNGPLPTWIGWYVQHLPHWFHASSVFATLVLELALVWMLFLPRRWRIVCFFIVTPWELGIILTANYTFLNYLVLTLGFLLLDDRFLLRFLPQGWKNSFVVGASIGSKGDSRAFESVSALRRQRFRQTLNDLSKAECKLRKAFVSTSIS